MCYNAGGGADMKDLKFEMVLKRIAIENHTTVANVRKEMQSAMDMAMASQDPLVQARWAAIPKKGEKLTLEEFVAYLAKRMEGQRK